MEQNNTLSEWTLSRGQISAPIMINLELTTACNLKCRHCYNFWREDDPRDYLEKITYTQIDGMIDQVVEAGVFHVVLTGGEPFVNFDVLEYTLKRCKEYNISTSVNSNLMLTTPERTERLKAAGLDHILTSMVSADVETNDYMMNRKGTLAKVIDGIKTTIEGGIRVSVNMVVAENNFSQIRQTAKLCAELGVNKLFVTRMIPSVRVDNPSDSELELNRKAAKEALDESLRASKEFGIEVGSLISYPLCFLSDLEKYEPFVGRGCPAQSGNRMVINANGITHACTHEERGYGNVFFEGLKVAFKRMHAWRDGSYRYEGCKGCPYQRVCSSGCRMGAHSYFKSMDAKDPLYIGYEKIDNHFKVKLPKNLIDRVASGERLYVPKRVRFRKEEGFHLINVRWANAFEIPTPVAEFLIEKQQKDEPFSVSDAGFEDAQTSLLYLLYKTGVEFVDTDLQAQLNDMPKVGASINPFDLPANSVVAV